MSRYAWVVVLVIGCGRSEPSFGNVDDTGGGGNAGTLGNGVVVGGRIGGSGGGVGGTSGRGGGDAPVAGFGGSGGSSGLGGRSGVGGVGGVGGFAGVGGGAGKEVPPCEGSVTSDVFDPERVYLAGALAPVSSCGYGAFAAIECPNSAAGAFFCNLGSEPEHYANMAQIRPTDGRILYEYIDGSIRLFRCDVCPVVDESQSYPRDPYDNDPVLVGATENDRAVFYVSPAGAFYHRRSDEAWVDEAGRVVYSTANSTLVHVGFGTLALARSTRSFSADIESVVDLAGGDSKAVIGLPYANALTIRAAAPDRFLVALRIAVGSDGFRRELWEIDATGTASLRGEYPPLPTEVRANPIAKLLPNGALLQAGYLRSNDVIVRSEIGGVSEVVYTEADDPLVKMHISGLVTGP